MIYKPFGYLSQFTKEIPTHKTLQDLYPFPPDVYSVGRLDKDSEGLLILTDDKSITERLLNPKFEHTRSYYAQVEGIVHDRHLNGLSASLEIKVNKKVFYTKPCQANKAIDISWIKERTPPIRYRKNIPTSWINIKLKEGKNRQVRKMCAKVGIPVLRLIRIQIEKLDIMDFAIGEVREFSREALYQKLFLE